MVFFARMFKTAWFCMWATLDTVLLFLPITITAFLSRTGNFPFTLSRLWALIMLTVTGVRSKIRGKEKIKKGQSYIIVSNHQSDYDAPVLALRLGIQFRWIAKQELRKIPLLGYALYASRNIFIDRSNKDQAVKSIREGVDRLPPGTSVMFFAEGTRSPDGAIHKFKKGGFVMALEKGLPILPVTVNGSRKVMPKRSFVFYPGTIEVVVSDPIETREWPRDRINELVDRTRNIVIANFDPAYPDT